jgi:hypothetical protein
VSSGQILTRVPLITDILPVGLARPLGFLVIAAVRINRLQPYDMASYGRLCEIFILSAPDGLPQARGLDDPCTFILATFSPLKTEHMILDFNQTYSRSNKL